MEVNSEIKNIKACRKALDEVLQDIKRLDSCREVSISITKTQEAIMWLGMDLKRIGETNPYPESYNPKSVVIHPTGDGLSF